jgi:hypothetical protein
MDKTSALMALQITLLTAVRHWQIEMWGEYLSNKNGWKGDGKDAIALYLVKKYGWTLTHCKSLSYADSEILLVEEMNQWQGKKVLQFYSKPFSEISDKVAKMVSDMNK